MGIPVYTRSPLMGVVIHSICKSSRDDRKLARLRAIEAQAIWAMQMAQTGQGTVENRPVRDDWLDDGDYSNVRWGRGAHTSWKYRNRCRKQWAVKA